MLHRITLKSTSSLQPGGSYWTEDVLYCGYDREEARRVYHENEHREGGAGNYGNGCTRLVHHAIEDAGTEDFSDDAVAIER